MGLFSTISLAWCKNLLETQTLFIYANLYIYCTYLFSHTETWSGMTSFVMFSYVACILVTGVLECPNRLKNLSLLLVTRRNVICRNIEEVPP